MAHPSWRLDALSIHVLFSGFGAFAAVSAEFVTRVFAVLSRRCECDLIKNDLQLAVFSRRHWLRSLWRAGSLQCDGIVSALLTSLKEMPVL
jgi:hypothetical protein